MKRILIALAGVGLIALVFVVLPPARAQQAENPLPGTKLSLDELRKQMFHVSAGRRLKPTSWPGGARVAVSLSFDVDNATATLSQGVLDYEVKSKPGIWFATHEAIARHVKPLINASGSR